MNAYFLPLLKGGNPYVRELITSLNAEGVEVCGVAHPPLCFLSDVIAQKVDIIHLHWLWGITARGGRMRSLIKLVLFLFQLLLARVLGVRIVFTAHNLKPHESPHPRIDLFCTKRVIELSHRTIIHGDSARDVLKRELRLRGRQLKKLVTIHHGHYADVYPNEKTKTEARRQLGVGQDDFMFLNLGLIRPYKGNLRLIDAFKRIKGDALKLVLAGRPIHEAFRKEIEQRIAGEPRILFFPAFIRKEDVQVFVKASDVMVFPFEDVLSSGSVILGLSFGRTCVAPAIGCIKDVVRERDGYLYCPSDPNGLLQALRRAIADRRSAAEKGARSRKRVLEWTWQAVGRQTAALYREVLDAT